MISDRRRERAKSGERKKGEKYVSSVTEDCDSEERIMKDIMSFCTDV